MKIRKWVGGLGCYYSLINLLTVHNKESPGLSHVYSQEIMQRNLSLTQSIAIVPRKTLHYILHVSLNKPAKSAAKLLLKKQSSCWWSEKLWQSCDVTVMYWFKILWSYNSSKFQNILSCYICCIQVSSLQPKAFINSHNFFFRHIVECHTVTSQLLSCRAARLYKRQAKLFALSTGAIHLKYCVHWSGFIEFRCSIVTDNFTIWVIHLRFINCSDNTLWPSHGDIYLGNTVSGNGLEPDGSKSLTESRLNCHQRCPAIFIWEQFPNGCSKT